MSSIAIRTDTDVLAWLAAHPDATPKELRDQWFATAKSSDAEAAVEARMLAWLAAHPAATARELCDLWLATTSSRERHAERERLGRMVRTERGARL